MESKLGLAREEGTPVGRAHGWSRVERTHRGLLLSRRRIFGALNRGGASASVPLAWGRPRLRPGRTSVSTGPSLRGGRVGARPARGVRPASGPTNPAVGVGLGRWGAHRAHGGTCRTREAEVVAYGKKAARVIPTTPSLAASPVGTGEVARRASSVVRKARKAKAPRTKMHNGAPRMRSRMAGGRLKAASWTAVRFNAACAAGLPWRQPGGWSMAEWQKEAAKWWKTSRKAREI